MCIKMVSFLVVTTEAFKKKCDSLSRSTLTHCSSGKYYNDTSSLSNCDSYNIIEFTLTILFVTYL